MNWRQWRYRVEYFLFRLLLCGLQMLSPRASARLAESLAWIIHHILPRRLTRYEVARQNLRRAFGTRFNDREIDRLIFRMWVHLFRMIAEIAQMPRKLRLYNLADIMEFNYSAETLRTLCCSDRPVILLGGHFGNWEVGMAVFGLFGFHAGVVARELDNPYLNEWFRKFRQSTGHRMIAKKGGYEEMLTVLEQGGKLAMLGDQDAGPRGLFVDFFGHPASTFKSIALLAIQYRALLSVGYTIRLNDDFRNKRWTRYEFRCDEIIDPLQIEEDDLVREITQRYTSALEQAVRSAPEQYFWIHRRWKSVPGQRRKKKKRSLSRKAG